MIELQSGEGHWRRKVLTYSIDESDVVSIVNNTEGVLTAMRAKLLAMIADDYKDVGGPNAPLRLTSPYNSSDEIVDYMSKYGTTTITLESWAQHSRRASSESQKFASQSVPAFIEHIDKIIAVNKKFVTRMLASKLTKDSSFIQATDGAYDADGSVMPTTLPGATLTMHRMPFQSQCEHCRKVVNTRQLQSHMKTARCVNYRTYTVVESGDNKLVSRTKDTSLYNLCNDGLIDTELIAYRYDAYVPNWVYNAYNIWRKNDGFAGMSLYDYLQKMKPESDVGRDPRVNIHMYKRKRDPR